MQINVEDETVKIIEVFYGISIKDFLEETKLQLINQYEGKQRMTIKQAASIMGAGEQFVRMGLQKGLLPFGVAIKTSSHYTYYISPKLFYEYIGCIAK